MKALKTYKTVNQVLYLLQHFKVCRTFVVRNFSEELISFFFF